MRVSREGLARTGAISAAVISSLGLTGCTTQEEAPDNHTLAESSQNLERSPALDEYQDAQNSISSDNLDNIQALAVAIVSIRQYDEIIDVVSDLDAIDYEGLGVIRSENGTRRIMTPNEVLVARLIKSGGAYSDFFNGFYQRQCELNSDDCETSTINDNLMAFHATVSKLEDVLGHWYASNGYQKDTITEDDLDLGDLQIILEGGIPNVQGSNNSSPNEVYTDNTYAVPLEELSDAQIAELGGDKKTPEQMPREELACDYGHPGFGPDDGVYQTLPSDKFWPTDDDTYSNPFLPFNERPKIQNMPYMPSEDCPDIILLDNE